MICVEPGRVSAVSRLLPATQGPVWTFGARSRGPIYGIYGRLQFSSYKKVEILEVSLLILIWFDDIWWYLHVFSSFVKDSESKIHTQVCGLRFNLNQITSGSGERKGSCIHSTVVANTSTRAWQTSVLWLADVHFMIFHVTLFRRPDLLVGWFWYVLMFEMQPVTTSCETVHVSYVSSQAVQKARS